MTCGRCVNMALMKTLKNVMIPIVTLLALLAADAPATAQAGCSNAGKSVQKIRKMHARSAINCLFNKARSANDVRRHGDLETAAQGHSKVMAKKRCYSHQCSGEPPLDERVARTGYLRGASNWELGEVIFATRPRTTPRKIVRKWLNSSGHRSVILDGRYNHVGIGLEKNNGVLYATADFGRT